MSKSAENKEDTSFIQALGGFKEKSKVAPLRSRPKGDADEALVSKIHNLPEGYGTSDEEVDVRATTSFRARISTRTQQEMFAYRKSKVGLTYAAMIEEMWDLYKDKHGI